jgi:hypothetical protein
MAEENNQNDNFEGHNEPNSIYKILKTVSKSVR